MFDPLNTPIPSDGSSEADPVRCAEASGGTRSAFRSVGRTNSEGHALALFRAETYTFLANTWHHPDEALVTLLLDPDRLTPEPELQAKLSPELNQRLKDLREACVQMRTRPSAVNLQLLVEGHARLFGHSVRGDCPLYELEYGRGEIVQQTAELADLSGFYGAFGMGLSDCALERADHVSVQCEFMAVLCAKEGWGVREDQPELAQCCFDAQRLFLRDHLARWFPAFAHRVRMADPDGFYGCVAALAGEFMREECQGFDIELGPQWLELRPVDPERDAAIDCDSASCGDAAANRLVQLGIEGVAGQGK